MLDSHINKPGRVEPNLRTAAQTPNLPAAADPRDRKITAVYHDVRDVYDRAHHNATASTHSASMSRTARSQAGESACSAGGTPRVTLTALAANPYGSDHASAEHRHMSSDPPQEPSPQDEPSSIRLTLAYDEAGVPRDRPDAGKRHRSRQDVEEVPAFAAARAGEPQLPSDAVVTELRDAADATTYRQIVERALPHDVEVFDPAVERGVRRHPQPLPSGVFTVIVPDDERAESVVLLAGPDSRGAEHGRQAGPPGGPVELTRFPLR